MILLNMLDTPYLNLMQKSLDAVWLRQRVISNNIANVDTPGYKSQDVKFEEYLNKSILSNSDGSDIANPQVVTNQSTSLREDGNNVDIDAQNLELYRTQVQYEYLTREMSDQFSNIRLVLTDGKG